MSQHNIFLAWTFPKRDLLPTPTHKEKRFLRKGKRYDCESGVVRWMCADSICIARCYIESDNTNPPSTSAPRWKALMLHRCWSAKTTFFGSRFPHRCVRASFLTFERCEKHETALLSPSVDKELSFDSDAFIVVRVTKTIQVRKVFSDFSNPLSKLCKPATLGGSEVLVQSEELESLITLLAVS